MREMRKDFQVVIGLVLGTILVLAKIGVGRWGPIELMAYGFLGFAVVSAIVIAIVHPIGRLADMAWTSKRAKDERRHQEEINTQRATESEQFRTMLAERKQREDRERAERDKRIAEFGRYYAQSNTI